MVRMYVLTENEVEIVRAYLEEGKRLPGFNMFQWRLRKIRVADLKWQIEIIRQFKHQLDLDKIEQKRKRLIAKIRKAKKELKEAKQK